MYKKLKMCLLIGAVVFVAAVAGMSQAMAKDLIVALRTEPTSMDPHFHSLTSNIQINQTIFDPLVCRDAQMVPQACLAESWETNGNVWTFKLRDAQFSDGTPVTAQDVVFSLNRIPIVPNAPAPLTIYLQQIESVEAVDEKTVRIVTEKPYPLLLNNLTGVPIMSATAAAGPAAEGKTTMELNAGNGLIGSGPYRFVSWQRGAELIFERNPHYWGESPEWDRVIYRFISNPASRVAALQAGDVDLIEDPPVENIELLRSNPDLKVVVRAPTYRMIFIGLDVYREHNAPGITGTPDGKNPLMDHRVREALSLAIDRQAIVERIMNGLATPAAQPLPYPMFGTRADRVEPQRQDLDRAKALLAEAGYPNGFNLVLTSTNGRYMNDVQVAQAIAAMWTRIGVKTSVDARAPSVYFSGLNRNEYGAYLLGWGAGSGEVSDSLTALMVTVNPQKGHGTSNYGHYSNAELDALVAQAGSELDPEKRSALLQEAVRIGMDDYAVLPLQFEHSIWAMRSGITYDGRMDQMTMVKDIHSVK